MIFKRWTINKDREVILINQLRPCGKNDNLPYLEFNLTLDGYPIRAYLSKWNRLMTILVLIKLYGEFEYGD
jgi:hypothetical protein